MVTRQELRAPITTDDVLLNMKEIVEGWDISPWGLRRLVKEGQLRRVRRPGNQPYYLLSSVEAILGKPKSPFTPRYRRGFELGELAA